MEQFFKRKIYDRMLEWKRNAHGRYALLIEGIPKVGKTSVAEDFAKREYRSYVIIDLSSPDRRTKKLLNNYDGDIDTLFSGIQASENTTLYRHESLVVFDNIQDMPRVRQMIGELVTDGRYDYIEIGTLVSLERHVRNISIPSEEVGLYMYPMDFEEFLWAIGDTLGFQYAREAFERREPVDDGTHSYLMKRFREYLIVGGMPGPIGMFAKDRNPLGSEELKRSILSELLSMCDRYPYNGGKIAKKMLKCVPLMLSKGNRQFSPNIVRKGSKTRDYVNGAGWLKVSGCSLIASNWDRLRLMIPPFINEESFKCYMCDTGLLATMAMSLGREDVLESILIGDMRALDSMIYENAVAQAIASSGHRLIFYDHGEKADFMLMDGSRPGFVICKPAVASKHVSFDRFLSKHDNLGECFVIHSGNLRMEEKLTYLPIYLSILI